MRLFREVISKYVLVAAVSCLTASAVVFLDLVCRHASADQWVKGFVAGCTSCVIFVALARVRRS